MISSADLSLDDTLSELEGVCKYARSTIELQRFVHVKQIAATARAAGVDAALRHLVPLVVDVAQDDAYLVRQHLALQIAPLAEFVVSEGGDAGYGAALSALLPVIRTLLMDAIVDVRAAATEGMVHFARLLRPPDREDVLTIVLKLAHETESEDLRVTGASLLNTLAPTMGKDLCCQFIAAEIVSLARDPKFRVRKAVSLSMHQACQAVGPDLAVRKLLPSFSKLARDEKFAVRRACAESIVAISRAVTEAQRVVTLIGAMEKVSVLFYRYILRESCSQFDSLPLISLTRREASRGRFEVGARGGAQAPRRVPRHAPARRREGVATRAGDVSFFSIPLHLTRILLTV
jgi:serine/threonine-protein phosphatase 4 regulatory subunit 1